MRTAFLGIAFFLLCAASFGGCSNSISRLASVTPLRWLANISYSYYLIYWMALYTFFIVVRPFLAGATPSVLTLTLLWLLSFLVSLVPSALLYLAIERPLSLSPVRPRSVA